VSVCARIIKTVIIGKQNLVPKLGHGRFRRTTANNIIIIIKKTPPRPSDVSWTHVCYNI